MAHEYDQITAFHYSAFRPSLHLLILKRCLEKGALFSLGLDVGCGTGQSSVALTNFCRKVIAIEPSKEMLQKTIKHPSITYSYYNKKQFNFSDDHFDIITFAGSLYYAKSQILLDEVVRVTKRYSKIIIYDFELSMDVILEKLNLGSASKQKPSYDHEVNFDELNEVHIKAVKQFKINLSSEISIPNLSHLLLSSKDNYHLLLKSLGEENLYNKLSQKLYSAFKNEKILIDTAIYSTVYQNIK